MRKGFLVCWSRRWNLMANRALINGTIKRLVTIKEKMRRPRRRDMAISQNAKRKMQNDKLKFKKQHPDVGEESDQADDEGKDDGEEDHACGDVLGDFGVVVVPFGN